MLEVAGDALRFRTTFYALLGTGESYGVELKSIYIVVFRSTNVTWKRMFVEVGDVREF